MEEEKIEELEGKVATDTKSLSQQIATIKIADDGDMNRASEWLTQVKARIKKLEEKRKSYVQPLNNQVKAINDDFKKMTEPYLQLEVEIKGKMGAYLDEQRRIQLEAERIERERRAEEARKLAIEENISRQKAAAEIRKQEEARIAALPKEPEVKKTVKTESGKTVAKLVTKFEIVDASKVPDEFKVVSETLVRQAVNAGAKRIAGVRIWEENQINSFSR